MPSHSITNKTELTQYLAEMQPGEIISGLQFGITDANGNYIDLKKSTILCRKRHSTKKSGKLKQSGYRYEVFKNTHLDMGTFGKVFPISATLKLNESNEIEILKKENNKQRIVKVDRPGRPSFAENEALFGVDIPYLHMKPAVEGKEKVHYLVMQKMPGSTLDQLLEKGTICALDINRKLLLLLSLLEALQSLHQQGLVHRDIKPDNIMVNFELENQKAQINIIDFGSCKRSNDEDTEVSGASGYIAPEANLKKSCQASDIFSLGKTFFDICNHGAISDPLLTQLMDSMTLPDYRQRISIEKAIVKLNNIHSRLAPQEPIKLVALQLSLLHTLRFNRVFLSILKKVSLPSQKLSTLQKEIKNPAKIKTLDFINLNVSLNLIGVLDSFKKSQNSQLGTVLIDAFQSSVDTVDQLGDEKLNHLRQSVVQAIFTYVQRTYQANSNDRSASKRRIYNVQTLLIILKDAQNEHALHEAIMSWEKTIERGYLGRSLLYNLVAEAAGLKNKYAEKNLFWNKSPSPSAKSIRQEITFDPLLRRF